MREGGVGSLSVERIEVVLYGFLHDSGGDGSGD